MIKCQNFFSDIFHMPLKKIKVFFNIKKCNEKSDLLISKDVYFNLPKKISILLCFFSHTEKKK